MAHYILRPLFFAFLVIKSVYSAAVQEGEKKGILKTLPMTGGDTAAGATLACAQMKVGGDEELLV